MASTYSNLGIELIGSGEQTGTWGTTTNTNLGTLIDQAISGYATYACTGTPDTITIPNGATGVARNMYLKLTGTGGSTLTVPTNTKLYFIFNSTASAITVKTSGAGVSVPAGAKTVLLCDGTDIVVAENYLASLTLGSPLVVASGGTGAATLTGYVKGTGTAALTAQAVPIPVTDGGTGSTSTTAYAVYAGNSAGTGFTPISPSTSGNVLKSDGTQWLSSSSPGSGSITASGYTQNTAKILGRTTASSGAIEEIAVGSGLTFTAGTLAANGLGLNSGTAVAASGQASIEFTGLPTGIKRITIMFQGFSVSGTSDPISVQIGPSGGVETSGYVGSMSISATSTISTVTSGTASFGIRQATGASEVNDGTMVLTLVNASTNAWVQNHTLGRSDAPVAKFGGGSKSLAGVLARVKILTGDTFDAGQVNIFYE